MLDIGVVLEAGEEERDDGNDDDAGGDHAQSGGHTAGNPAAAVPDEHGDVDGDDAGKTLAQGVVIHNGFFIHPLVVLDDFPPQNRQHGVTAAEGHGAHAEKQGVEDQ